MRAVQIWFGLIYVRGSGYLLKSVNWVLRICENSQSVDFDLKESNKNGGIIIIRNNAGSNSDKQGRCECDLLLWGYGGGRWGSRIWKKEGCGPQMLRGSGGFIAILSMHLSKKSGIITKAKAIVLLWECLFFYIRLWIMDSKWSGGSEINSSMAQRNPSSQHAAVNESPWAARRSSHTLHDAPVNVLLDQTSAL